MALRLVNEGVSVIPIRARDKIPMAEVLPVLLDGDGNVQQTDLVVHGLVTCIAHLQP